MSQAYTYRVETGGVKQSGMKGEIITQGSNIFTKIHLTHDS